MGREHPRTIDIVRTAVATVREPQPPLSDRDGAVPVAHYTSPERLARERALLFRRLPIPLACTAELVRAGTVLVRELDGVSLLLARGADGALRGFKNACRHRATRLLREDACTKAFVCPYHGWAYGLDGALMHVPHPQAFPSLDRATHGLVPVRVEERHGLVWVSLDDGAPDVRTHLGPVDDELAALSFGTHHVARRVVREQQGNWKMLMEAFLEGYHIRTLHRDSVYPFFFDARSAAERAGAHVRHATARRAATPDLPLREQATFGYMLFPCTTLIAHPDWTSHVVVQPLAPDRFLWAHTQLIAEEPTTDEARAHFARSFALIEENVFQQEDLRAIAEMQRGLETGANDEMLFGRLESPALWLHDAIRERLGES